MTEAFLPSSADVQAWLLAAKAVVKLSSYLEQVLQYLFVHTHTAFPLLYLCYLHSITGPT